MPVDLVLRDYQVPASDYAMDHDKSVLAIAPNGGKTEIAIYTIKRFLSLHPNERVLVLAHDTDILRDQFYKRLEKYKTPNLGFTYSTTFEPDKQVHITLPQSERQIRGHYAWLVVDEAHENYLAKQVQRIIKKIRPDKQILLTGTPAKLIRAGGFDIYCLAVNSLPSEYFAKLHIELVASNYNWKEHLNANGEIRSDCKYTAEQRRETFKKIIDNLVERVKYKLSPEEFNDPTIITKIKMKVLPFIFKKLGRTMFICRRIREADEINKILQSSGVNSVVSHHEDDIDSENIKDFTEDKYDVLIVVGRAKLGYSDDGLYNIIDMSGTHDPNNILQIICRGLRGGPSKEKFYLKVTTQEYGMMDYTHACVCAALMLTDNKYLSMFNGYNFKLMVPVIKKIMEEIERQPIKREQKNEETKNSPRKLVFPEFTHDVVDQFRNIIHNLDNPVSIYKAVSMDDIRKELLHERDYISDEEIFESVNRILEDFT